MTDTIADGLKPCPFCGSPNVSMSYWASPQSPEPAGHFVECEECGCAGPGVKINDPTASPTAEQSAIEGWNTRPSASVPAELVERVARALYERDGFTWQQCVRTKETEYWLEQARAAIAAMPPAGRVEEWIEELVVRITEHAVIELDADEENTLQINAFGEAVEREIRAALSGEGR